MVNEYATIVLFSSRRRHTRYWRDWSSDVCSSDLRLVEARGSGALLRAAQLGAERHPALEHDSRGDGPVAYRGRSDHPRGLRGLCRAGAGTGDRRFWKGRWWSWTTSRPTKVLGLGG